MKPKTTTKSRAGTNTRAKSSPRASTGKNAKQASWLDTLNSLLSTTKGKMLAFALVFGVLGVSYLAFSHAATPTKYFSPTGTMTRQAAAAFLYRQASSPAPAATTKCGTGKPGPYTDVSATQEFCAAIEWAGSKGIMTPDTKNNINPTGEVTRQAMAAFMYRAASSPTYAAPTKPDFTDVPTTNTFYKEISWMKSKGYTTGYGDGTFKPTELVTRQAAASYIWKQAGSPVVDVPQIFADTPSTNPFYAAIQWMGNTNVAQGFTEEPKSATCIKVDTGAKYACTPTQKIQNDKDVAAKKAADAEIAATTCVADKSGATRRCSKEEHNNQAKFFGDKTADCLGAGSVTYKCTMAEKLQNNEQLAALQRQADAEAAAAQEQANQTGSSTTSSSDSTSVAFDCHGETDQAQCNQNYACLFSNNTAPGCAPKESVSSCPSGQFFDHVFGCIPVMHSCGPNQHTGQHGGCFDNVDTSWGECTIWYALYAHKYYPDRWEWVNDGYYAKPGTINTSRTDCVNRLHNDQDCITDSVYKHCPPDSNAGLYLKKNHAKFGDEDIGF